MIGFVALFLIPWFFPFLMSWKLTIFLGLALVGLAGWLAQREHTWLKAAQIVPGTVTELIPVRSRKGGTSYKPRVRYTTPDGAIHDFVRSYSSSPAGVEVGEPLAVAYRADQPGDVRIVTFGQRYGFTAGVAVLGVALALLGATFLTGRLYVPRVYSQGQTPGAAARGW